MDRHHRKPKSKGGQGTKGKTPHPNISCIPKQHHRAWHLLFGTEEPPRIAEIINDLYLDPAWELVAKRRK